MKSGDRYYIRELADYFGISTDTLRLYDKLGILSPHKNAENNYRIYTREDIICLDFIMKLKKINMSLDEINTIINDADLKHVLAMMQVQEKILNDKIQELQDLTIVVQDYEKTFLNTILTKNRITIEDSPTLIYKSMEQESSLVEAMSAFEHLTTCHIPKFTFLCSKNDFLNDDLWVNINSSAQRKLLFRNCMTMKDDEEFIKRPEFVESKGFKLIKPRKCLHTIFESTLNSNYENFHLLRNYIKENDIEIIDDVIIRFLLPARNLSKNRPDYNEIWIPIK